MRASQVAITTIVLLTLVIRLYFALNTPNFTEDKPYFHIRQSEQISKTMLPAYKDDLSWSGRTMPFSPAYHYLTGFMGILLGNELASKIVPNLLMSTIPLLIYLISLQITQNTFISLLTAITSAFIPVTANTINSPNPITLAIPLMLLLILFLIQKKPYAYLTTIILLSFTHPIVLLFVLGLAIYVLICTSQNIKADQTIKELTLLSIFFSIWAQLILYKKALITKGISAIWQNAQNTMFAGALAKTGLLQSFYYIGLIPLIATILLAYKYLLKTQNTQINLFFSIITSFILATWLQLISVETSLQLISITIMPLFSKWLQDLKEYLPKTKFPLNFNQTSIILIALITLTMFIPFINTAKAQETTTNAEIQAMLWLRENTPKDAIILSMPKEGHLITAIAERKNVIDTNYLLAPQPEQRTQDTKRAYTTYSLVELVSILEKYDANYLYVSKETKNELGITELNAIDLGCFRKEFENEESTIYYLRTTCTVKKI